MNTQSSNTGVWQERLYVFLALAGLVGTWAQALGYLDAGFLAGNIQFWKEVFVTPASTFIVVDIFVLSAALFVWMFADGRRLGIGGAWLWGYFLGSVLIGISFAFPLFMAHRQRMIRATRPAEQAAPRGADLIAIGIAILLALTTVAYSLTHCLKPA